MSTKCGENLRSRQRFLVRPQRLRIRQDALP